MDTVLSTPPPPIHASILIIGFIYKEAMSERFSFGEGVGLDVNGQIIEKVSRKILGAQSYNNIMRNTYTEQVY